MGDFVIYSYRHSRNSVHHFQLWYEREERKGRITFTLEQGVSPKTEEKEKPLLVLTDLSSFPSTAAYQAGCLPQLVLSQASPAQPGSEAGLTALLNVQTGLG